MLSISATDSWRRSHVGAAIGLLIYGLIVITWVDTIIRPYIISRRTKINSAVVLVSILDKSGAGGVAEGGLIKEGSPASSFFSGMGFGFSFGILALSISGFV